LLAGKFVALSGGSCKKDRPGKRGKNATSGEKHQRTCLRLWFNISVFIFVSRKHKINKKISMLFLFQMKTQNCLKASK